jgi:hypothetical protein
VSDTQITVKSIVTVALLLGISLTAKKTSLRQSAIKAEAPRGGKTGQLRRQRFDDLTVKTLQIWDALMTSVLGDSGILTQDFFT